MQKCFVCLSLMISVSFSYAQWQKAEGLYVSHVVSFAQSPSAIYALGERDGVFRSTDNGRSWTARNNGLSTEAMPYNRLLYKDSALYLGTHQGIFVSTDEGMSWAEMNQGLPDDTRVYAFCADDHGKLMSGTSNGIFIVNNQGSNWDSMSVGLPTETTVFSFTRKDSSVFAGTSKGVFVSTNQGNSWTERNNGMNPPFIYSLAVSDSVLYAGTSDGVFRSDNLGLSWTPLNDGLLQVFGVWVYARDSQVYAGTKFGLFALTDSSQRWTAIKDGMDMVLHSNNSTRAMLLRGNELFAGGDDGISLSVNGGSWEYVNEGLPAPEINTLATNGLELYASTESGLYSSSDQGMSWRRIYNRFTSSVEARDSFIYVGSNFGNIYTSADKGDSWTVSTGFFDNGQEVFAMAGSTIFAKYNVSMFSDGTGFISTDNGATFSQQDLPFFMFANRDDTTLFAVDSLIWTYNPPNWTAMGSTLPEQSLSSLAANGSAFFVGASGGVWMSPHTATNWTKVQFGQADGRVTNLAVSQSAVFACNSDNQVFASHDNGMNWISITDNFSDSIISPQFYGTYTTHLLVNQSHLFVAGQGGIWTRALTEVTGIEHERPDFQWHLFPNPTQGRISVHGADIEQILVLDELGRKIYATSVEQGARSVIDLSEYPGGMYVVHVQSGKMIQTKKLWLQK
ncbi:MAG: T9SS type A sorting domain-containing protein [Bacteroidota bacterium]